MIHLLGLAHTSLTTEYSSCAFSSRSLIWASMMSDTHTVTLYGGPDNEARVDEFVPVVTRAEQQAWFPWYDPKGNAVFNSFDPASEPWREFNARCAAEIRERYQPGDILAITMGLAQKPVYDALADTGIMAVEPGIGYSGVWAPFRVFESHAWRAFLAAREPTDTVRLYDAVIPRAWEMEDFPSGDGNGGYFLFIGRLMERKGPHIAAEACKRIGAKLIVAGQGAAKVEPGRITCDDGTLLEGDVEYAGIIGPEERARLMGRAIATFAPTLYLEPGGGTAIESQLVGTPAITTDYGCFTESVIHGETGYRCNTLAEFAAAARNVEGLNREHIRHTAKRRYSTEAVAPQFIDYFDRLATLRDGGLGWYS